MKDTLSSIIYSTAFLSLFSAGAFGTFGAVVQYLYLVVKGTEEYSTRKLLLFCVMGFFVGVVTNELIHVFTGQTYPGIVLVSGFIFMKVLDFLDGSKLQDLAQFIIKK